MMVRTHPGHPRYHHPAVEAVPLINCMELQLRFLSPADIDQVRHCQIETIGNVVHTCLDDLFLVSR